MRHLVILMKQPVAGRVKTRLARDIGPVAAAWWFRHQCAALLRRLARDRRWRTFVAVTPDRWAGPPGLPRLPQGRGDLGQRIAHLFTCLPPGPALIIATDVPGITPADIALSFALAARNGAVLGPSPDGGYWLIGLRRCRPLPKRLFKGVRWSGRFAMEDTIRSLAPLRPALAATRADVDTGADLARLQARKRWPSGS